MKKQLSSGVLAAIAIASLNAPLRAQETQTSSTQDVSTHIAAPGELEKLLASRPRIDKALSLDEAVEIALRESPVIRGAQAEVQIAEAQLRAARAERRPQLSLNGFLSDGNQNTIVESASGVMPSMTMALPPNRFADLNVMGMLPLYTGGRLEAMTRRAASLKNAAQNEAEAQRQEVALLTRTAYREVLARRALVDVAREQLRENEEQLRIDRVRAEEGKIPPFYVLRDEAEVAATQQMLTDAERDVELSLVQLKTVMGVHPQSSLELSAAATENDWLASLLRDESSTQNASSTQQTDTVPAPPPLDAAPLSLQSSEALSSLLRAAETRRPELQAATSRIEAGQSEVRAARSAYRPQVNAFVAGDIMKMQGMSTQNGATYGIVASIPLFDGGARQAGVQSAQAEIARQQQERERVALQIAQEVSNALLNARSGERNVATAEAALKSAREDYRLARVRYEAGRSTLVEVLDALAARTRAESNAVQAQYNFAIARDTLRRAVGERR
jgi:outer membrane protein